MEITVSMQILSGNMFNESGYDELQSAKNYAELAEEQFREAIEEEYPDAEISIDIDVQAASGARRDLEVFIEDGESEEQFFDETESLRSTLEAINVDIYEKQWDEWAVEEDEEDEA
jgi:predicted  nucleic acid-binding Zn-ribbon protein